MITYIIKLKCWLRALFKQINSLKDLERIGKLRVIKPEEMLTQEMMDETRGSRLLPYTFLLQPGYDAGNISVRDYVNLIGTKNEYTKTSK